MRVDFYIVQESTQQQWLRFVCRLVDKAYHRQHKIYIHCQDAAFAKGLDDLLWTFEDNRFIPHNLTLEPIKPPPAVQIGYPEADLQQGDILINLSQDIPDFHSQYRRVIEVVYQDERMKENLRQHYRFYQQQSYAVHTHKIGTPHD